MQSINSLGRGAACACGMREPLTSGRWLLSSESVRDPISKKEERAARTLWGGLRQPCRKARSAAPQTGSLPKRRFCKWKMSQFPQCGRVVQVLVELLVR